MTTVQPQNTLPANTAQLTYCFLAAVCLIVFLLWLVTLAAGSSARGPKAATMKSSEKVEFLKSLPESFQIFTNVSIGVRTNLDAVIVGTNGVFIVDVKTRSGKIEPTAGSDWIRHKVGSKGTPYRVPMKNPLQQMKRNIRELQSYLASCGVRPWIDGSVCFTRAEFEEQIEGCYTSEDAVLDHIKNFPDAHPLSDEEQKTVAAALAERL